jgi:hypothetical protein
MAIGPGRGFLTAALLVIFILLTLSAWRFMTSEESLEAFEDGSAPTRAANCQCLPGYIPSNRKPSFEFVLYNKGYGLILSEGKMYGFWWNMHGIPFDWQTTKIRWTTEEEVNKYKDGGYATPKIVQDALRFQKEGGGVGSFYFCQSLSNPGETRKCY